MAASRRTCKEWRTPYRHDWLMNVRNLLRANGFGESDLGVDNLDDYAVGLVELAVAEQKLDDSAELARIAPQTEHWL